MAREHYETLQQVFDDAYRGLAMQGFVRSVRLGENGASTACTYRGDEGRRCALGHCIPDDRYTAAFEGFKARNLTRCLNGLFSESIGIAALNRLQEAHDDSDSPQLMQAKLAAFAEDCGLTVPDISPAA